MDINTIRGVATVVVLIGFMSVVFWAYSGRRKKDFDEAAGLPFADELTDADRASETAVCSQTRGVKKND